MRMSRLTDAARQFAAGAGLFARGVGLSAGTPGLLGLGLVPAAVTGVVFLGAFSLLASQAWDLAAAATWFAESWSQGLRDLVRWTAAAAIVGLGALLAVLAFTAVTLMVGDPFYERISERVEARYGGAPEAVERPLWAGLRRTVSDSLRMVSLSLLVSVPVLLVGLVPVVGQVVAPVAGAAIGGWFLALELVGGPFARRGLWLAERRAALRAHRPLAIGFGVAVFVCFLIPLGAVVFMPAAVAGATLLTRRVLDAPS